MPHPARLETHDIATAAATLLEEGGPEAVSMRELARRLGIRAPSLYFHVENRDAILKALVQEGLSSLGARLAGAATGPDPSARLHAMADAYIAVGFERPQLFALLFGPCPEDRRVEPQFGAAAAAPLMEAVAALGVAATDLLDVAQATWSLVHGYTVLALTDQFQMGGDPRRALHAALDAIFQANVART